MVKFEKARSSMGQHLQEDEGLYLGYMANVAMLLSDRFNRAAFRKQEVREAAANEILSLIFSIPPRLERDGNAKNRTP